MCVQAKNPSRDLPIAILGSLSVATVLYLLMALAITMMARALGFRFSDSGSTQRL